MEVKHIIDFCISCGKYCEQNIGVENYDLSVLDLKNYSNYKDLYVYECPTCGLVSFNLSRQQDADKFLKIKDTEVYQDIMDYSYLEGLDLQLFECHTKSVPANQYEVYAKMLENTPDTELYLRALNKSIELKEAILNKYTQTVAEDGDSEDEEILEDLRELLLENIDENRKLFLVNFWEFKAENIFLYLMAVENLAKLGDVNQAEKYFELLASDNKFDEDLVNYFKDIIERGKNYV